MKIALWSDVHWNFNADSFSRITNFMDRLSKENFDVLVIAGDMATRHVVELREFAVQLRIYFPTIKVLWVLGNHDIAGDYTWITANKFMTAPPEGFSQRHMSVEDTFKYIKDVEYEFNIYHLFEEPQIFNDTLILGFDGWYGARVPGAMVEGSFQRVTDYNKISPTTKNIGSMDYLRKKAKEELEVVLNYDKSQFKTKILVTHFPPYTFNPKYNKMIADETILPLISEQFNYLFVGHNHQDEQWNFKGCEIFSCGNDYEKCKAKIIDTLTNEVKVVV